MPAHVLRARALVLLQNSGLHVCEGAMSAFRPDPSVKGIAAAALADCAPDSCSAGPGGCEEILPVQKIWASSGWDLLLPAACAAWRTAVLLLLQDLIGCSQQLVCDSANSKRKLLHSTKHLNSVPCSDHEAGVRQWHDPCQALQRVADVHCIRSAPGADKGTGDCILHVLSAWC